VLGNEEKLVPESFRRLAAGLGPRIAVGDIMAAKQVEAHQVSTAAGRKSCSTAGASRSNGWQTTMSA